MHRRLIVLIGLVWQTFSLHCQHLDWVKTTRSMLYDSLESERLRAQEKFSQALDSFLTFSEAWEYPFDTIRHISVLKPDDEAFRLFTWNVPLEDGTYRFFGRLRWKNDGKKPGKTVVLTDASEGMTKAGTRVLKPDEWYGALYYQVVKTRYKKSVLYTLLGWDGNTPFSNKKLIDVLTVMPNGEIRFGAPVFEDGKRTRHRVFFEHAEKAVMSLRYQSKSGYIVFDHLAPSQPSLEGQYEFYAPDFTTDAYHFEKGKWKYILNYEARNEEDVNPRNLKKPERGLKPEKP